MSESRYSSADMFQRSGFMGELPAWPPKKGITESPPMSLPHDGMASSTPAAIGHWRAQTYFSSFGSLNFIYV